MGLRSGLGWRTGAVAAGVVLLGTVLAPLPRAGATGTLDQQNTASEVGSSGIFGSTQKGQTFTAGLSGTLDQVDVDIDRVGTPGDLTVQIFNTSGGLPTGAALTTATVSEASVPTTETFVSVPLSSPAPSVAGTEYAIVLSAPSGSLGTRYEWWVSGDAYPGGTNVFSTDGGSTWGQDASTDFRFKTYVSLPAADLSITKTDNHGGSSVTSSNGSVTPGSSLTYTVTATNSGPSDVSGASVTDTFPTTFLNPTFTSTTTGGASGNTASGTGNIADTVSMPSGSTITYTITGTVSASASGSISNTAAIFPPSGGPGDPNLANNTATDSDTIPAPTTTTTSTSTTSTSTTSTSTTTTTLCTGTLAGTAYKGASAKPRKQLPAVQVNATGPSTGSATTNSSGAYSLPLRCGTYTESGSLPGRVCHVGNASAPDFAVVTIASGATTTENLFCKAR